MKMRLIAENNTILLLRIHTSCQGRLIPWNIRFNSSPFIPECPSINLQLRINLKSGNDDSLHIRIQE